MKNLSKWEKIIEEKRKKTDFNTFIQEVLSWLPIAFYKNDGNISRYPSTERSPKVISNSEFAQAR